MTVTVNHAKTNAISDWTQAQLDEQIALGNFAPGTTLANIVLPSDWNNDHTLTGLGTMAEQNANSVAITGGSVDGSTIGATTASTGKFTTLQSTGNTLLNTTSGTTSIADTSTVGQFGVKLGTNFAAGSSWDSKVSLFGNVNLATGAGSGAFGVAFDTTQGTSLMSIAPAVAWYNMQYLGNTHRFFGLGLEQFRITPIGSSVNLHNFVGSATTKAPIYSVIGSDTNISMAFQPKGTGAIDLAAGSSGVNISNGGTVTAITRTALGTSYTSPPTVNISAPTTAGGVQATATVPLQQISPLTLVSGGTGYTVGDTLTISGGTFTVRPTMTVATVSGGVITSITQVNFGVGTVIPSNPMSVTGGTGSGATFSTTAWGISAVFTITNAGSGYIEQPTITFSGGGGSGAAAYATVGGTSQFKSIGNTLNFLTPNSNIALQVYDSTGSGAGYWRFPAGFSAGATQIASSTAANIATGGAGNLSLQTNANVTQAVVSHTASAVNYVQVTGGATGGRPVISTQGSDANAGMNIQWKGQANMFFLSGNGAYTQFRILGTNNAVNNIAVTGTVAGSAPFISAEGTDTNIDLTLTPKGTGVIQFGTHTANADVAISGYITIKDSGGTLRKLAVIT